MDNTNNAAPVVYEGDGGMNDQYEAQMQQTYQEEQQQQTYDPSVNMEQTYDPSVNMEQTYQDQQPVSNESISMDPSVKMEEAIDGQGQINLTDQIIDQGTHEEQNTADEPLPDNWRPGDWKCPGCGDHNFASRSVCRRCGTSKAGGSAKKDDDSKPDNWRPGDWKCTNCGDHQFASRMYCRQCDAPKSVQRSTDPHKVYCGNLKSETLEESLREAMEKFGEINDCYILGPKGNNKGFGFCIFKTEEASQAALTADIELDGNKIKIEKSMSRQDEYGSWAPPPRREEQRLYIGGVSKDTTEEQMKEQLVQFGKVTDCVVMSERGFGFATFADSDATNACLRAKIEVNGAKLDIQRARPKRDDAPPPWARGGRGYGGYDDYGPPPPWARGPPRGYDNYYGYDRYDDYYGGGYDGWGRGPPRRSRRYGGGGGGGGRRRDRSPRRW